MLSAGVLHPGHNPSYHTRHYDLADNGQAHLQQRFLCLYR